MRCHASCFTTCVRDFAPPEPHQASHFLLYSLACCAAGQSAKSGYIKLVSKLCIRAYLTPIHASTRPVNEGCCEPRSSGKGPGEPLMGALPVPAALSCLLVIDLVEIILKAAFPPSPCPLFLGYMHLHLQAKGRQDKTFTTAASSKEAAQDDR